MTLQTFRTLLRRALTPPLVVLAALWLLIEEVIWVRLGALVQRLSRLPAVARLEVRIAALPPYAAMALFGVPTALLLPIKLGALYLITTGHAVLGIAIIVVAKAVITAVVARLFALCRTRLLSIAWFAWLYAWIMGVREELYRRVRAMPGWQRAQAVVRRTAAVCRQLFGALRA